MILKKKYHLKRVNNTKIPINALASCSRSCGITCLDKRILLDVVEETIIVIFNFAQFEEILRCLWAFFIKEIDHDLPDRRFENDAHCIAKRFKMK